MINTLFNQKFCEFNDKLNSILSKRNKYGAIYSILLVAWLAIFFIMNGYYFGEYENILTNSAVLILCVIVFSAFILDVLMKTAIQTLEFTCEDDFYIKRARLGDTLDTYLIDLESCSNPKICHTLSISKIIFLLMADFEMVVLEHKIQGCSTSPHCQSSVNVDIFQDPEYFKKELSEERIKYLLKSL